MPIYDLPLSTSLPSPSPDDIYPDAEGRIDSPLSERFQRVLHQLETEYPPMYCFLDADTPFQLLVAVILSAQCTDEVVNQTTPDLFAAYPTPESLAAAPRDDVEELIYSTGFYKTKAGYIQESASIIHDEYGDEIPQSLDELTTLPGVARKTATAVLWYSFGMICGITVDTHVDRLADRLGFSSANSQNRVEKDLMELVPQSRWPWTTYLFISHGRAICSSQSPDCQACSVTDDCPAAFSFT